MRKGENRMAKRLLLGSTAATLVFCHPGVAAAEDLEGEQPTAQSVNEIVVVARKKAESLQDVPVVVTALDAATLERNAVTGFEALSQLTPGLRIFTSGNQSAQGAISLRGIQTGSINLASDQAVALNIDGVQIDSALALKAGMFDLQQVEVLKGPQALYFGKNSSGGVISLRTADPTSELFLQARAGYEFNARERYGEVIASGPLSSTLGARLALSYTDMDGVFRNLASNAISPRVPNGSELIARGTLKWEPSDRFDARVKFTYTDRSADQFTYSQKIACFRPGATTAECKLDGNVSQAAPIDPLNRFDSDDTYADSRLYVASLDMNYDLTDELTLTSVTGYYNYAQSYFDSVNPRAPGDFFVLPSNPNEILYESKDELRGFTQELRLTSDFDGRLNFMVGAFLDDRRVQSNAQLQFGTTPITRTLQGVESNAYSFFGQLSFDILENLELAGGARYTNERRKYFGELREAQSPFPVGTPLIPIDDELRQDNVSPEATLTYKPTPDLTLFAAYKEGFKSGSFDIAPITNLALLAGPRELRFDSESAKGFEVGFKSLFFDNQLRINAAYYDYKYEGLQVNAFDSNTAATRVLNVAAATTRGVDFDAQYAPNSLPGLVFNAAINYNRGRYEDFITDCNQTQVITGTCPLDTRPPVGPESQSLAGKPLKSAPEWTAAWGASLNRPLTDALDFRLGWTFTYSSEYQTEEREDPLGVQDAYLTMNANVGVSGNEGRWSLDLLGINLTNERYMVTSNSQPFTGGGGFRQDYFANVDRGRQIRLQLTVRN